MNGIIKLKIAIDCNSAPYGVQILSTTLDKTGEIQ